MPKSVAATYRLPRTSTYNSVRASRRDLLIALSVSSAIMGGLIGFVYFGQHVLGLLY